MRSCMATLALLGIFFGAGQPIAMHCIDVKEEAVYPALESSLDVRILKLEVSPDKGDM